MPTGVYKHHSHQLFQKGIHPETEFKKGHPSPKYWLGKKLSKTHKKNISKSGGKNKGKHWNLSKETRKKMSASRVGKIPPAYVDQNGGRFSYVKRGWYKLNGKKMFFRSGWEYNYARYLDFLVRKEQIKKWEYEVDVFIFHKIQFGTRSYRPDFKVYNLDGTFEYHEVKGWMDKKSATKLKRMRIYYPKIKLVLIESREYKEIMKYQRLF